MVKKALFTFVALSMILMSLIGCTTTSAPTTAPTAEPATAAATVAATVAPTETVAPTQAAAPVEISVVASQPEYMAQEQAIWKVYTDKNPNVTIKMTSVNEDTAAAFNAQVAAGNAPDIQSFVGSSVTKDNYKTYTNLLNIGYPDFDKFSYDVKTSWSTSTGVADYLPVLAVTGGPTFSFIYYSDMMDKTGLKPRDTIRSMADLDKFLADLKVYCDANSIPYVLDTGWHAWCWFDASFDMWAFACGANNQQIGDLWNGKVKWTDLQKNPYVPVFQKLKDYYDKGYLPKSWWTRNWESDFEASFVAKQAILCYHGPWLWTKVLAADPNAQLAGFPLPANQDKVIRNMNVEVGKGSAMFTSNESKPNHAEVVKAFIWWNSAEAIKMRCEAFGDTPAFDLQSVGGADIKGGQYQTVIKPIFDGFYGQGVKFDGALYPMSLVSKYMNKNAPEVMGVDETAPTVGKYFDGTITIDQLMQYYQQRFDTSYTIPQQ